MWKTGNGANELDNLDKETTRQNIGRATWILFIVSDEVLMKRDEIKNTWFIVLIEFGRYVHGRDHLCSQKMELKGNGLGAEVKL